MHVVTLCLSISLLFCGVVGLQDGNRARDKAPLTSQVLCPSYPYPVVEPSAMQQILAPFLEDVGNKMSAELKTTPGGAVVSLVYRDTVIWTYGYGAINMSDPSRGPPTANTGFRIGSITKVFTSLMMLMLRDAGELKSIDENITNYLPEFSIQNPFQTHRGISFRQLSSHMSGLPRNPPCPGLFETGCNLSYSQIYDNLAKMRLMFPPGTQPEYSNLGFGLLGRVLEKIQGPTWEEQVEETVIKPLKMNNTGNAFTPDAIKKLAVGYYSDGSEASLIDIGWGAPAGQMYSSANDLSQLLKLLFRPEVPYDVKAGQILDGETIREWMQPAYNYADGTGFGYPWELRPLGNYTLRTKDGVINGYNSELQFAHEIKTGFVFLHSCDGCSSHEPVLKLAQSIIEMVNDVLMSHQPGPALPPSPSDYFGNYTTGEGDTATVVLSSMYSYKALILIDDNEQLILDWREGDEFQISLHGGPQLCYNLGRGLIGEWVYFSRSGSQVTSFTIPGLSFGEVYTRM